MSDLVVHALTALALVLGAATVLLLLSGQYFFAGFLLTLVAFVIYFREVTD